MQKAEAALILLGEDLANGDWSQRDMVMRIAFILHNFPTISQTFVLNQITGLIDRGHEVDIYADRPGHGSKIHRDIAEYQLLDRTYYWPSPPRDRLGRTVQAIAQLWKHSPRGLGVLLRSMNVLRYGRKATSLRLLYQAVLLLNKAPYDIIHCHFGPNGLTAVLLREIGLLPGKLITSFHGFDVNVSPRRHGAGYYDKLFHDADLYTVNTTFTARQAVALGCPEDKIVKLPVGFDASRYTHKPRVRRHGEPLKLLTVARLVEKKGLEYSIRAVAKVAKNHPDLTYQIAGDGRLRGTLENLIAVLGLSDRVELLGWKTQDEVRELYAEAHLFILSSVTASNGDREGQGLVLQEAQAMGLPVLSTLHNGIPEGVLDGESGFLVPERDVDALAKKLAYLVEHPEVWPQMGRAGRAYVAKHYDIRNLNDRLVKIYERVLGT